MEDIIIKIDGKEHKVKVEETEEGRIKVHLNGEIYEVETKADIQNIEGIKGSEDADLKKGGDNTITAPLPGTVAAVNVKKGQKVNSNYVLLKIIAMKMENEILSHKAGVVKEVRVKKNDNVDKGDVLVVIE